MNRLPYPRYAESPASYYAEQPGSALLCAAAWLAGLLLLLVTLALLSPEPATPAAPAADVAGAWRPWSESVNDNK